MSGKRPLFPSVVGSEYVPNIGRLIFNLLDTESQAKARGVCSDWKESIDKSTQLWSSIPLKDYVRAANCGKVDMIRMILRYGKNHPNPPCDMGNGITPLHAAALDPFSVQIDFRDEEDSEDDKRPRLHRRLLEAVE